MREVVKCSTYNISFKIKKAENVLLNAYKMARWTFSRLGGITRLKIIRAD